MTEDPSRRTPSIALLEIATGSGYQAACSRRFAAWSTPSSGHRRCSNPPRRASGAQAAQYSSCAMGTGCRVWPEQGALRPHPFSPRAVFYHSAGADPPSSKPGGRIDRTIEWPARVFTPEIPSHLVNGGSDPMAEQPQEKASFASRFRPDAAGECRRRHESLTRIRSEPAGFLRVGSGVP